MLENFCGFEDTWEVLKYVLRSRNTVVIATRNSRIIFKIYLHGFAAEITKLGQDAFLILEIELPNYCQYYGKLFYRKICHQTCHKTF